MAPEQWNDGEALTEKIDVHALAVLFWELLSGKRAWEGKGREEICESVLNGKRPPLESVKESVGPEVTEFISRMWRQDVDERPSAAEIAEELKKLGDSKRLFDAVRSQDSDDVRRLVTFGLIDVNCRDEHGQTPLCTAAEEGHDTIVEMLLEAGANKDKTDENGRTPLYAAAEGGHDTVVEMLLEARAQKDEADKDGKTALYAAAFFGHDNVVSILLEAGANKDTANDSGQTPLQIARQRGHEKVVALLQ
uniref:Protein kinase domain-containing protein n=1 Tax=Chromera velia CCMP2878 TaxID=1169474 RepID=A0A0G4G6E5_9ALVE|eukprot:Cvel_20465.t1-p1 / transcript=Cvel_20465.t1 / gene=Cvel_20465 / organism=Chromera_velia_CCMP2878 / gene_product=Ankyrin repeat domain-containing protein 50, putative / transcript_product=Ankyrin repeat domain-containing protein 50, putative / location=Cvel_scaffold1838:19093-22295(-) / protein_length=249 / sequence_SO=supercontig / SO=protein_coding / is_pseudo=false